MNIYKLKAKEITDLQNEFNKTLFGRRALIFSLFPFFGAALSFILFVIENIINEKSFIFLGLALINLALFGVAELLYSNMLKEYAQSKKDKE